jgi:4a-hydroxytetrahydrobiopterin dehydratase
MTQGITIPQFRAAEGVEDWRVLGDGTYTAFRTGSFAAGTRFVSAIGELAGIEDHAPDVDLRHDVVTVRLLTYEDDWYGMSQRDVDLARRISAVARDLGVAVDPFAVETVGPIVIDALDIPAVMPFWRALFDYEYRRDSPDEDLVDPRGRGPAIWFQQMDAPRPQRNRIHVAAWVAHERAEARLAAVIAAGGTIVIGDYAPSWWMLADPEGNEADLATTMGRD